MGIPSDILRIAELYKRFDSSVSELIRSRYSCRVCLDGPVAGEITGKLTSFAETLTSGPFGAPLRFSIIASAEGDSEELRGLGTYGFIRNPAGFIAGTAGEGKHNLEDFGFAMELLVLYATELGLGTCWLGGSFTRSRFSRKINLGEGEILPAVVSMGYPAEESRNHTIRRLAGSDRRHPWEMLFFDYPSGLPLSKEKAGIYTTPMEMVRLAPSASNNQPWRIMKENDSFHFYLNRNKGMKPGSPLNRLMRMADLQRVDMGIAMCHFELALHMKGISGRWKDSGEASEGMPVWEYSATWTATQ
jgi:nitroreductase